MDLRHLLAARTLFVPVHAWISLFEAAPFVTFHIKLSDQLSPWEADRRFSQQGTWLIHLLADLINLRCIMMHTGGKLFRYLFARFTSSFDVLLMIEINRKVNWIDKRESLASHTQKFKTPIRQPSIKAECGATRMCRSIPFWLIVGFISTWRFLSGELRSKN